MVLTSALVGITLLASQVRAAPATITIPEEVSCKECRLELRRIVTLGSVTDSISPAPGAEIIQDRFGRYFVSPMDVPGAIGVYANGGALVTTIGSQGQGPHQFSGWMRIAIRDDSLRVYDSGNAREAGYSRSLRLAYTKPLPEGNHYLRMGNDLLVQGSIRTPERAGFLFHLFGNDGGIRRSFGETTMRPDVPELSVRYIQRINDHEFWAAHNTQYTIEHWRTDGRLIRVLKRSPKWFKPWNRSPAGELVTAPPQPRLRRIHVRTNGEMLTLAVRADRRWKPMAPPKNSREIISPDRTRATFDTVIEQIDPTHGRIVARFETDDFVYGFVGEGNVFGFTVDEETGLLRAHISELKLVRK